MTLIEYPLCSTCKKAKRWLDTNGFRYENRHIRENPPTAEELKLWWAKSGLPLKRFFNTSGQLYKSLQLKERLPRMSNQEQLDLLASDGMLVKRPLLIDGDRVLVGFREDAWAQLKNPTEGAAP